MLFRGAALSSLQKQLATASSSSSSVSSSASVAASVTAVVLVTASSYGAESSSNEPARTNGDDGHYLTAPAVGARGAAFPPSLLSRWRGGNDNGVALCRAAGPRQSQSALGSTAQKLLGSR